MPSVRELVTDSMFMIGTLGQGDVAMDNGDAQVGVRTLARMLDSWANDGTMVYALTKESINLVPAQASYSAADLSTPNRPAEIDSPAFITHSGVDYPFELITRNQFDRIEVKGSQGVPEYCCYEPSFPQPTFAFYPTPYAAMVARFNVRRPLVPGPITLETDVLLPPGYERAIVSNLAIDLAPSFGKSVKQELVRMARQSRRWLKDVNYVPGIMRTGFERGHVDIYTGP